MRGGPIADPEGACMVDARIGSFVESVGRGDVWTECEYSLGVWNWGCMHSRSSLWCGDGAYYVRFALLQPVRDASP